MAKQRRQHYGYTKREWRKLKRYRRRNDRCGHKFDEHCYFVFPPWPPFAVLSCDACKTSWVFGSNEEADHFYTRLEAKRLECL